MNWLNLVLALLGSLAAFGALNKMKWGTTKPCIIGATLLIALGLAGQWLSLVKEEWLPYVDTALYGGILALLVASQRVHTWFLERFANPIASSIALVAAAVFVGGLLSGCAAAPETPECDELNVVIVRTPMGTMLAFEPEPLTKRMRDLQAGKCHLPGASS